jgi:hypothetical protein
MTVNPNAKIPETLEGTTVYSTDPLIIRSHYEIDYMHSYAQDSEFFRALGQKKIMGSKCKKCGYKYATPRAHCMFCGSETEWFQLPNEGMVHTFTTCYFGSEEFLKDTPFHLIMVEFDGVDSLFMARLVGVSAEDLMIGMKVKAKFKRNQKFSATDVYFVPVKE